jgi:hypothetical protein
VIAYNADFPTPALATAEEKTRDFYALPLQPSFSTNNEAMRMGRSMLKSAWKGLSNDTLHEGDERLVSSRICRCFSHL